MTEYSVEKFYDEYALKKEDTIIAVIDTGTNARKVRNLLNEQDKEIKRLKCINRQLEERLDRSIALNMSKCGKYVYGIHGGSND